MREFSADCLNLTLFNGNKAISFGGGRFKTTDPKDAEVCAKHPRIREVVAGPAVTSISPRSGPSVGGTMLVISGSNFDHGTQVFIGGLPAVMLSVEVDKLTAKTPAHVPGMVQNLIVSAPNGQVAITEAFQYDPILEASPVIVPGAEIPESPGNAPAPEEKPKEEPAKKRGRPFSAPSGG